jgi:outer membrane protein OmpA-like peptidoglycan-associated protein/tetratricopeptide (TPR) repeat protein
MKKFCRIAILFSLVTCTPPALLAQYNPDHVSKKASQLYTKAMDLARDEQYTQSIEVLKQAIKVDPNYADAYLSLAGLYNELKDYAGSAANFERARAIDSIFFKEFNLSYSISLAGLGEFARALSAVEEFLSIPNLNEASRKLGQYRRRCYEFAVQYARDHDSSIYRFEPKNLGDSVNSEVSEYWPTLSLDGKSLVFTRRVNNDNEDFYESRWTQDHWSRARPLAGNLNTNFNEAAQTISQDGQWLIFVGCNFPGGLGSCDLYISYNSPDGWSAPENLGKPVNTEFFETAPSLSADKRDLYFASNRPGGFGGNDIYVSHRMAGGRWSTPENLGPTINTAGDESAPFIHADNQTLYFTSNGHVGYGGDDLFLSRKGPDGRWGSAQNLGYPVNTIGNELSLFVASDGKTAYYASDRSDSRGGLDLYTFELRAEDRPARTLWVKGKVFDQKTHKGLPTTVELTDLNTHLLLSQVQTDETGNYLITLPVGKDWAFNVSRKGYLFFSGNFPLSHEPPDSTYQMDIALEPIEAGAAIVLKNIFFDVNKYDLKTESEVELDQVVTLLKENPALVIQINGYTDNSGKSSDNLSLSENRAKAVVTYLIGKSIDPKRLSSKGLGDTSPIASNDTEQGRAQNRRTELKVVSIK